MSQIVNKFLQTVGLTKGGTGQTTANASLNALLPSQSGIDGYQQLVSDGTNTSWLSPLTEVSIFDDMTWGNESQTPSGPFGLVPYGNAGGGPITPANVTIGATAGRWGVMGYTTGSTNNSTGAGGFFSDYAQYYCGQTQTLTLTGSINIPVLATVSVDYAIEIGFRSSINNGLQTNSAIILYQRATSTNWLGYTSNAGVTTTVTSSIPVTTGWWNYKIVITSTTIDFYVATVGGSWQHIGQSTTHLLDSTHTAFLNCIIYKASTSATASKMYADWIKVDTTFASTR